MKALLSRAVGGPETLVLTDVPEPPKPGAEEILLCVKAPSTAAPSRSGIPWARAARG